MHACLGALWVAYTTLLPSVQFDFDKANIRPTSYPDLEMVAALVKARGCTQIEVQGHLDRDLEYRARDLSRDRAESVRTFLIDQAGIDAKVVFARGYGNNVPRVPPDEPGASLVNRRIEIVLLRCVW